MQVLSAKSIEQWVQDFLEERGLFESQAREVIADMKADAGCSALAEVWHQNPNGYPVAFLATVAMSTEKAALEWIDTNMPKHFARPMFLR